MIAWYSADPEHGLPALVRLPGDASAAGTNRCLYVRLGPRVARVGLPGPWTIEPVRDGLICWSDSADVIATDTLSVNEDRRVRRGLDLVIRRTPGGPWECDVELPLGARWARDLRPFAEGSGLTWSDAGYRYRWRLGEHIQAVGRARKDSAPAAPETPEIPDDATTGRRGLGGLRVIAWREEGELVRGWLRDGAEVVAQASDKSNS